MKRKIIWKTLVMTIALFAIVGGVRLYNSITKSEEGENNIFSLEIPSFIEPASASGLGGQTEGTSFLQEEAGISAYTNVGEEIDLEKAKNAFRTIEYETDEYIIGSVPLPNYPETEDVHCYIHIDGWIVSYYLKNEPAAKIVDWNSYTTDEKITGTKLENGITVVCDAAGVLPGDIKYYDFKYPNANSLMIVADAQWVDGTDTFNITLPSDFRFYERSYSHYAYDSWGSKMKIDGSMISNIGACNDCGVTHYGLLSPSQIPPEEVHTVSLSHSEGSSISYDYCGGQAFDAIVLIYQEA